MNNRAQSRIGLLTLACCCGPLLLHAQGPASTVHVASPQPRLISGQQVQLSAITRDQAGIARQGDVLAWSSSNNNILSVDARGMVTARRLGIADVAAAAGSLRGTVRLQVLPQRVEVLPITADLFVGDRLQYAAAAFDIRGAPIPEVVFQWQATGANGVGTQAASISNAGLLTARAVGPVTVRALINYPGVVGQFVNSYVTPARATIRSRKEFRLSRLLSTEEVRHSFLLRAARSAMVVNDAGQAAFAGALDGLTNGLLLYENGRFEVLASAGQPAALAGGIIFQFSAPVAINNRGEVLARAQVIGSNSGLMLASRRGATFVLVDGQAAPGIETLGTFELSRHSLNDNGDIVFWANGFRRAGSTTTQTGIYRLASSGVLQLVASLGDSLPGITGPVTLFRDFGIDGQGVVYFRAFSATTGATLYRQERFNAPIRILGPGDPLANSQVRSAGTLAVAGSGEAAFSVTLQNNAQQILRLTGETISNAAVRSGEVLATHPASGVLFRGDGGSGSGLYRWHEETISPVLLVGRPAPNEQPIRAFDAAAITSQGQIFAQVRTAENDFVIIQPGGPQPLLAQLGARVEAAANLVFSSLVGGARWGPAHLMMGSGPGSVFELDRRALVPRLVLGDSLPDLVPYRGASIATRNSSGDLYFVESLSGTPSTRRLVSGSVETVLRNFRAEDGVNVGTPYNLAVNDRGAMVWAAGTGSNHNRLYLTEGGQHTLLAYDGREPRWETASPAGGVFITFNQLAVDRGGRVMMYAGVRGGPAGYFLYANGRWQATALVDSQIGGVTIFNGARLKAVEDRFYAIFSARGGGSLLVEYRDQVWTPVINRYEPAPTGGQIILIGDYDVNRRGDMVFVATLNNGPSALLTRSPDGLRLAHLLTEPTETGDYLLNVIQVDLRDDGRFYFFGMGLGDRYLLYSAEPLFSGLPIPFRSRQRGQ